jgi:hypothetical protein
MAKYKGRGDITEPWEEVFLKTYTEKGGKRLSAKDAGVTWERVQIHIDESPRFAKLWDAAREEHGEHLERQMLAMMRGELKSSGFMPLMARLKGELPAKYNDKLQIAGAVSHVHSGGPTPVEVAGLVREMLLDMRPETRAAIAAEVTPRAEVIETTAERIDHER